MILTKLATRQNGRRRAGKSSPRAFPPSRKQEDRATFPVNGFGELG
jgi:hypothetical protein